MTLEQLVQAYLQVIQTRLLAASTQRCYRYVFTVLLQAFDGQMPAVQFDGEHFGRYLQFLKDRHFSPTTKGEHLRTVRAFLHWSACQGHLPKNPVQFMRLVPEYRPAAWIPTLDQVEQLLAAPITPSRLGRRDRVVLELLYGTGLRRSELEALDVGDVDFEAGGVWVRQGKGSKDRLQPLGSNLQKLLLEYLEQVRPGLWPAPDENALLLGRSGRRLKCHAVRQILKLYAGPLGMPQLSHHSLRRAFATHMLQQGAPLPEVQQLLSHQDPETTLRYTQIGVEDVQREYQRTHPRAGRRPKRAKRL